jgi:hypothetical protein
MPSHKTDRYSQHRLREAKAVPDRLQPSQPVRRKQSAGQLQDVDHPGARVAHRCIYASPDAIFGSHNSNQSALSEELTLYRTDWILEDPHRSAHAIGPRLVAGAAFLVVVMLSLGLGWSIWAALCSLAAAVLKSVG